MKNSCRDSSKTVSVELEKTAATLKGDKEKIDQNPLQKQGNPPKNLGDIKNHQ